MKWPRVPFLEAIEDASSGNIKVPQRDYLNQGRLPVVDQGARLIGGFTDNEAATHRSDSPVIIFGDHTKVFKYIDFPFVMGADGVKVLKVRDGWNPRYVYHYLQTLDLPEVGYSRHYKFLKQELIPLPPLNEQRRIAAVLDQVETLRSLNDRVQQQFHALTQHLFTRMFDDPDKATNTIQLGAIARLSGGRNLVGDDPFSASAFRVLKISAVTSGRFIPEESKPLPGDYEPPDCHLVKAGDLLMSRANTTELVGAVALVYRTPPNLALPDKIWRFEWLETGSNAVFYHALLSTRSMRRRISQLSSGSGGSMKNISKAKLSTMQIPHISIGQQEEFARLVDRIDRRAEQVRQRGDLLEKISASLQTRAFRGEL